MSHIQVAADDVLGRIEAAFSDMLSAAPLRLSDMVPSAVPEGAGVYVITADGAGTEINSTIVGQLE